MRPQRLSPDSYVLLLFLFYFIIIITIRRRLAIYRKDLYNWNFHCLAICALHAFMGTYIAPEWHAFSIDSSSSSNNNRFTGLEYSINDLSYLFLSDMKCPYLVNFRLFTQELVSYIRLHSVETNYFWMVETPQLPSDEKKKTLENNLILFLLRWNYSFFQF